MSIKTTKNIEGKFDTLAEAEEFLDRVLEDNGDEGLLNYAVNKDLWSQDDETVWVVEVRYSWDVV